MTDLIESEDELLDPQPGPAAAPPRRLAAALHRLRERTPLRAGRETDPERRRRLVLAGLLALAVAAGAGATGVAVHRRDLHSAEARTQDRTLLHLLGGSAALSFSPADSGVDGLGTPSDIQEPLSTDFTIALRNDGAKPLEVTGVGISVPGVDVLTPAPHKTLSPGDTEALTTKVAVHCTAPNLQEYPSGVTVDVRTPAAKGKPAGSPTTVRLAFDPGHPSTDTPSSDTPLDGLLYVQMDNVGSYSTTSFYRLCGDVLTRLPPRVSATAITGSPSPENPVVSYSLHIDPSPDAPQMALPLPKPPTVPGVSAQTDLTGPEQIGSEGLDVTITDRITDCSAFGDYLAVRGGATQATEALNAATPIGLQPVDPRFRTTPVPLSSPAQPQFDGLTPGTADLQSTMLTQLAAVCPDL